MAEDIAHLPFNPLSLPQRIYYINNRPVETLQHAAARTPTPQRFHAFRQRLLQSEHAVAPIRVHRKLPEIATVVADGTQIGESVKADVAAIPCLKEAFSQPETLPAESDHSSSVQDAFRQSHLSQSDPDVQTNTEVSSFREKTEDVNTGELNGILGNPHGGNDSDQERFSDVSGLDDLDKALLRLSQGVRQFSGRVELPLSNPSPTPRSHKRPRSGRSQGRRDVYEIPRDDEDTAEEEAGTPPKKLKRPPRQPSQKKARAAVPETLRLKQTQKEPRILRKARRAPIDQLALVADRVMPSEEDNEHVQSGELIEDPIEDFPDGSEQLQPRSINASQKAAVQRSKKKSKLTDFQVKTNYYGFSIELSQFNLPPGLHALSPNTQRRLRVSPTCSDGFEGREARHTGRKMPRRRSRHHKGVHKVKKLQMGALALAKTRSVGPKTKAARNKGKPISVDRAAEDGGGDSQIGHDYHGQPTIHPRDIGTSLHEHKLKRRVTFSENVEVQGQLLMVKAPAPERQPSGSEESSESSNDGDDEIGEEDDEELDEEVETEAEEDDTDDEEEDIEVEDEAEAEANLIDHLTNINQEGSASDEEMAKDEVYNNEESRVAAHKTYLDENDNTELSDEEELMYRDPLHPIQRTESDESYEIESQMTLLSVQQLAGADDVISDNGVSTVFEHTGSDGTAVAESQQVYVTMIATKPTSRARQQSFAQPGEDEEVPWRPRKPTFSRILIEVDDQILDDENLIDTVLIDMISPAALSLSTFPKWGSIDLGVPLWVAPTDTPSEIPETQFSIAEPEEELNDEEWRDSPFAVLDGPSYFTRATSQPKHLPVNRRCPSYQLPRSKSMPLQNLHSSQSKGQPQTENLVHHQLLADGISRSAAFRDTVSSQGATQFPQVDNVYSQRSLQEIADGVSVVAGTIPAAARRRVKSLPLRSPFLSYSKKI